MKSYTLIELQEISTRVEEGKSCVCSNQKTYKSLDLTSICPKLLAGDPCKYCYVQTSREEGFNAKIVYGRITYNGEISRMNQATITKLNECGGLRVFSFADYYSWMDDDLEKIVADAKKRGLKLKAITKQAQFVHKFWKDFDVIHVSVDNIGDGMAWETAKNLREMYPTVLVRSVITKDEDIQALAWTDILTLNHGNNGFKNYSKKNNDQLSQVFPGKVCCSTGKCQTCKVKCGLTNVGDKNI